MKPQVENNKPRIRTIFRILHLLKEYWYFFIGFMVFVSIVSISQAWLTIVVKKFIDFGVIPKDIDQSVKYLVIFISVQGIFTVSLFIFIVCAGILDNKIQYSIRKKLFNHLQNLSFSFFDKHKVGWIIARCNSDVTRIGEFISWHFLDMAWGTTNILASIYFMFMINWRLGLIIIALIPVLITIAFTFQKYIIREYRKVRNVNSQITGAFNENITGVRVVKSMVREKKNLFQFGALTTEMYHSSYKATWLAVMFFPIVQIITSVGLGAVVWYGGLQARYGQFTIGDFKAFIGYLTFMIWPIQEMARVYAQLQQSIASAEKVFNLLDTKKEIVDHPNAKKVETIRGKIEFKNVTFYYEKNNPILTDFSIRINAGEKIALVGTTGGGKTTLVNLACRFYEPVSGQVLIDDIDYREYTQESIHSKLGIVLQTSHLFSGTIRDNIRYGNLNASDTDVILAAKKAHAHPFITELENQYDEEVGENGVLLSVGQKQLISIARAILANPSIIIMDEATSSIDTQTEHDIQMGVEELTHNCTSFIIAHRLSTIKNVDRILYIENGGVIEQGSHEKLMELKGKYYHLYKKQFITEKIVS